MIPRNDPILETELVLIYIEEKPAFYGRVEQIIPDVKPKWWRVTFLFLTVPVQMTTWIIDDAQIRGADFTMGGTPIRIEKLEIPTAREMVGETKRENEEEGEPQAKQPRKARVVSLHDKNAGGESST